jgi:hypothetical protein
VTDHDMLMVGLGANVGAYLIVAAQAIGRRLDDRRDRQLLEETRAKLNAGREGSR